MRNARREKPVLDDRGSRTRRKRPAARAEGPRQANRSRPQEPKRKTKQPKRKPRRRSQPVEEIHWRDPQPFNRRAFFWKLAATLAVALAIFLGFSIFFKVERIYVSGTEIYTPETVLEASGISVGENLIGLSKAQKASNILSSLPYVKEVQIGIKLPDTVNISIVELAVTYSIQDSEGRWWLMDSQGKVVEGVNAAEAREHTSVLGILIQDPVPGEVITPVEEKLPSEAEADQTVPNQEESGVTAPTESEPAVTSPNAVNGSNTTKLAAMTEILQALEANNLMGEVRSLDLTYLYYITMQYEDRYEVRLGEPSDLTLKIGYMVQAVKELPDYQVGVLDLSTIVEGGENAVSFIQETEPTEPFTEENLPEVTQTESETTAEP